MSSYSMFLLDAKVHVNSSASEGAHLLKGAVYYCKGKILRSVSDRFVC